MTMPVEPVNVAVDFDWGVPDWRDETRYLASDVLTDSEWRWQFLRRRPSYREEWLAGFQAGRVWHDVVQSTNPDRCERDYGLSMLLDPRADHSDWILLQSFRSVNVGVRSVSLECSRHWSESGLYLFRFDLKQAIRPQIVRAERFLTKIQREMHGQVNTPKPRRDNWPLFLRALDAKDAGASYALMVQAFWPEKYHHGEKSAQSARDIYKAAVRLRENFPT